MLDTKSEKEFLKVFNEVKKTLYYVDVGADSFAGARQDRVRYEKAVNNLIIFCQSLPEWKESV